MYALEKALIEKPITIESVYKGEEKTAGWGDQKADKFICNLSYKNNNLELPFFMGKGNRVNNEPQNPSVAEVLNCLLIEAFALELTFSDWCSEYGYDADSRTAESIFKRCNEMGKQLKRFLGDDFEYFMENNEY